jgi:hypothetical protein
MKYWWAIVIALAALLVLVGGCKKDAPGSGQLGETKGQVAGLTWGVPKSWTVGPEKPMRAATYMIAPQSGETEGCECAVFHFGQGVGGDVESNVARWATQFEQPEGPKKESKEVNSLKVTIVQIAGTFLAPGGPMMMSSGKKENYRLLGAIVDGPQGSVFFKLTGPAKTVTAAANDFDAMVNSLTK